jgi:hypothetical protein
MPSPHYLLKSSLLSGHVADAGSSHQLVVLVVLRHTACDSAPALFLVAALLQATSGIMAMTAIQINFFIFIIL